MTSRAPACTDSATLAASTAVAAASASLAHGSTCACSATASGSGATAGCAAVPSRASTTCAARGARGAASVANQAHVVRRLDAEGGWAENVDIVAARLLPARLDDIQGRRIVHVRHAVQETRGEGGADRLLALSARVDIAALRGWKGVGVLSREIATAHASRTPSATAGTTRGAPVTGGASRCPSAPVIRAQN